MLIVSIALVCDESRVKESLWLTVAVDGFIKEGFDLNDPVVVLAFGFVG